MSNKYPHTHIWINSRKVSISAIVDDKTVCVTEFEKNTFSFIRDWMLGKEKFDLQTSGSTGIPKEISATRSQMTASANLTIKELKLKEIFNALVCLDTRYIAGKMMLVRSLECGMKIFALNPTANPFIKIPVDVAIQFAALVPYQIKAILESKHPHMLDSLETCIIGGAPLDENTSQKLQSFSTRMYATYGMTETLSHIALQALNGKDKSDYYQTLPGITVSTDKRNCLVIHAPYLNEAIVTNDVAEVVDANKFKWLGRWDNVINSGGVKLSAEDLEEKIGKIFTRLKIPNQYFIHGLRDEKLGEKVALVLVSPLPDAKQMQAMREAFLHSFSAYEIPKEIFEISSLVYTPTSKINRQESFLNAIRVKSL
jgi:O-succinylbenzoic acid--CoA ligase